MLLRDTDSVVRPSVSGQSKEAIKLWQDVDEKVVEDALSIFIVFQPKLGAYNPDRLGDTRTASYQGVPVPEIRDLSVKG